MSDISKRIANLSPEKLARLQKKLKQKVGDRSSPDQQRLSARASGGPSPLSFGQERLWFVDQLQPNSPAYNIPAIFPLFGPVSPDVLERCIVEIVRRHEILRTTFTVSDGRPVQVVHPARPVSLVIVDLSHLGVAERDAELQLQVATEIRRPFDLATGPVLRTTLVRLTPRQDQPSHLLVCVMHHVASDAWSLNLFLDELTSLYDAYGAGRPSPLPELPIQYADFAIWQRETLKGPRLEGLLSHWTEKLKGAPRFLKLPTDHPRPPSPSHRGAVHTFTIPAELYAEVRALSERAHTTLFMTTLAAFDVLLSFYTGMDDLVVGTPIANRGRAELERMIGFFLNTLALRARIPGDATFLDLLAQVRAETLDAYGHQDLPFDMLVEAIKPERSLSVHPIFQVMFVMQSALPSRGPSAAGEDAFDPNVVPTGMSRFDLTLSLVEGAGRITGSIEYSTDLFEAGTIRRMGEHYRNLLEQITRSPSARLSELSILTPVELVLVRKWNDTAANLEHAECIHHLIEQQARAIPDAIGVDFEGQELTYGELNARANQVAHHLRARGVGPEVLVGIFIERSIEMIIGLLGVLKAGGAYVPLDPTYPADRLQFMLADTGISILLTHWPCEDRLPSREVRAIYLDRDWEIIARSPRHDPESGVRPDHPAYVIYTSGSSGRPKGVVVPHRGACNAGEVEFRLYRTSPRDRVLQFASLNFDASVFELLMWMRGGSTLQLVSADLIRSGPDFAQFLEKKKVTVLPSPPSALAALPVAELPTLRLILVMGEDCPPDLVARWRHVPEFFNCYGPTECSMWMVGTFLRPDRPVTIGRPIANTQAHLLDRYLRAVPVGVPGELYIGGVCVTRGYLKRPDLTAERFVPDPFSDKPGARMYRTGDLAAYTPDGEIQFLGRIDNQIKIRAFRVELSEIEAALAQCPGVKEAVVIVRDDLPAGRGIVGYVISAQQPAPSTTELRKFLSERLPDYMVPAAFVVLDAFPLTQAGKADRRALPAPEIERPDLDASFLAPTSPEEKIIAGIWSRVLGLPHIGVNDNFFDLGGHSLLAAQIISRMREAFQLDMPIRYIFEHATIGALGSIVEAELQKVGRKAEAPEGIPAPPPPKPAADAGTPAPPRPRPPGVARQYPLSFAEERLWFLRQLRPDDISYNIPMMFSLGSVEPERLKRCLNEIVRRHEILRTTFQMRSGRPIQVVAPALELEMPVIDLRAQAEPDRQASLQQICAREAVHLFDLTKGPLLQITLVLLTEAHCALVMVLDHIIADGWSLGVLFREVAALYAASLQGVPSPLPELPMQYGEYAERQRASLQGEALTRHVEYWKKKLEGIPVRIELPLDHPRAQSIHDSTGATHLLDVPDPAAAALRALSQREQMTLFIATLAAFQAFLWRYTRHDTIVVGSPVQNRSHPDIEPLIGFFVNMLVLRADLSARMTFRELIRQVREAALEAYAHQELPFEKLIEEIQPERDPTANPVFQVMFTLQNVVPAPDAGSGPPPLVTTRSAKFDLSLTLMDDGRSLKGGLEYKTALFEGSTIARMAGHLTRFLSELVLDLDRPIADIPLMPEAEREALAAWNRTDAQYPTETCVHELFAAQAARTPDAVAVVSEDQEITYAELDRRSLRVALQLRELGIREERMVGICLVRSIDLIVAILGVLRAGGAYLPLDPEYPDERLLTIVKDARLSLVVTSDTIMGRLSPSNARLLRVQDCATAAPEGALRSSVGPRNAAYVIYTSGSTGVPKGAINTHEALVNRLLWMQETYQLTPQDRVLQKTSIGFDVSVWELLWPIITGAALVLAEPGRHRDAVYLADAIARYRITHVHFVPSMLQAFLEDAKVTSLPSLRRVLCSGEELTLALQEAFFKRMGGVEFHNLYGPTEAAIDVTWWPCTRDPARRSVPIGHAIANTRIYVLDRQLSEVPVGIVGEIYIGGIQPARGYLDRSALTAERFLPDPLASLLGARMYRTGDLGRRLPGGEIEYLGRIDHQVKIRGVRIELGEIEATLLKTPGVRDAAVVLGEAEGSAEKRLVAYYLRHADHAIDKQDLRRSLQEKLPINMVPALYVELDAFPLTSSGKLNRKALPRPRLVRAELGSEIVAPRSPLEALITAIWIETLGVDRVGVEDDFFHLGGHSLIAIQMLSRLRDRAGVDLSVSRFFNVPTPALLAAELRKRAQDPEALDARAAALLEVASLSEEEVEAMLHASQEGRLTASKSVEEEPSR